MDDEPSTNVHACCICSCAKIRRCSTKSSTSSQGSCRSFLCNTRSGIGSVTACIKSNRQRKQTNWRYCLVSSKQRSITEEHHCKPRLKICRGKLCRMHNNPDGLHLKIYLLFD